MRRSKARGGAQAAPPPKSPAKCPIVAVGASAGGMEAFTELLRQIPKDSGLAFVLVQHLDPTHPSHLSEALAKIASVPVEEIRDGTVVHPDHVYVVPSNADLAIVNDTLSLLPRPAAPGRAHLAIDAFFKALATDRGDRAIGVVLSGTGSDGAEGLRAIRDAGGVTLAQDPTSAKFSGMPEAAIRTGVVDVTLPIPELAAELLRIGRHPFVRGGSAEDAKEVDADELTSIFALLRSATRVDFSEYKPASVRRRVARRMALRRVATMHDYVALLREDRTEAPSLFADVLIHVTSFFRDPDAFAALKATVFPEVLKQKSAGGTIRIWVAGCSTGEEAYSLLIALVEFLIEANASEVPIQLFGTDVSDRAIEKARSGLYPESAVREVGADRLTRFFTKVEGGYRINANLRERCAFVKHDLASDPPFSKVDLVSCRNVLIYFGQALQRRVLAMFHFALSQPGFLLLGHSENIVEGTNLFSVIDGGSKVFARTAVKSALWLPASRPAQTPRAAGVEPRAEVVTATSTDVIRRTESLLLDRYAPPGVIVNERLEVLHFRGRTGAYLEPAPGEPQSALLKMARKGLMADLRLATAEARKENKTVRRAAATIESDGTQRPCNIVVIPVLAPPHAREHIFAVLFEAPAEETAATKSQPMVAPPFDTTHLARLDDELRANKEYLQSVIGEHQQTNEELTTTNEELVSSNEELQTLNEEFLTAKEELQATNEEMSTLNEELQTRNSDLNTVNGDLINVLANTDIPLVIVDGNRRIRRFTPEVRALLNLQSSDIGRPIADIKTKLRVANLDVSISAVIASLAPHEEEAKGDDGRWYRLQIRPYTTVDKRIDGAVLTILDIDVLKKAVGAAEWTRDLAQAIVDTVQLPEVVLDERLKVLSINEAFSESYGVANGQANDKSVYEIVGGAFDVPSLRIGLGRVVEHDERLDKLELERDIGPRGVRSMLLSGRSVVSPTGERIVLLAAEDITDRKRSEQDADRLLEAAPDAVLITNRAGEIVRINAQTERLFGYARNELLGHLEHAEAARRAGERQRGAGVPRQPGPRARDRAAPRDALPIERCRQRRPPRLRRRARARAPALDGSGCLRHGARRPHPGPADVGGPLRFDPQRARHQRVQTRVPRPSQDRLHDRRALSANRGGNRADVSDNGIGLPTGFAALTPKSLGMHLMRTLARQLDGTLSFEVRDGTRCTFQFSGKEV